MSKFIPSKRQALGRTFSGMRESTMQASQSTFFGTKPPSEVSQTVVIVNSIDQPIFRRVLQFVVEYMKGTELTEQHWTKFKQTVTDTKIISKLPILFSGLFTILKTAIRSKIDVSTFKNDLTTLSIPQEFVNDLILALQNSPGRNVQSSSSSSSSSSSNQLLKSSSLSNVKSNISLSKSTRNIVCVGTSILKIEWRVDVSVMTSWTRRLVRTSPSILIKITSRDGKIHQFEMTVNKFHQLRYSTARLMKEIQSIESLPILKIDK